MARPTDQKVVEWAAIARLVHTARASGRRIVFTNGCFDVLHYGHISMLRAARDLGDVLIVGMNGTDSIRRLKGPARPYLSLTERTLTMAELACVDSIVVFDDDTPLKLIEHIRPDVLVKGGDYAKGAVVGGELVESYGGEVRVVRYWKGISSTVLVSEALSASGRDGPLPE